MRSALEVRQHTSKNVFTVLVGPHYPLYDVIAANALAFECDFHAPDAAFVGILLTVVVQIFIDTTRDITRHDVADGRSSTGCLLVIRFSHGDSVVADRVREEILVVESDRHFVNDFVVRVVVRRVHFVQHHVHAFVRWAHAGHA